MRKPVAVALLFLAVVLAGDRLGAGVLRRLLLQSQSRFSTVYRGAARADVLVVGDSRAVNGVNRSEAQRLGGQRVFNLGYNGMGSVLTEALIADYLDHNA